MYVYNDTIAETCRMMPHAIDRYIERFGGDEERLAMALKGAVPYGGQRGDDMILLNGNIAFITKPDGRQRAVVTVLTREQAMANFQAFTPGSLKSHFMGLDNKSLDAKPKPAEDIPERALTKEESAWITEYRKQICNHTNESLIEERQKAFGRMEDGDRMAKRRFGDLIAKIDDEIGRRKAVLKQDNHARRMERENGYLRRAMSELLTDDKKFEIYNLANSYREQEQCEALELLERASSEKP